VVARQATRPARAPGALTLPPGSSSSSWLEALVGRLAEWRWRAKELKADVYALYLAAGDPRVPWYAKALAFLVTACAFSPIDLIPDFIPVLGHLDDLVLLPLGIALTLRLIPPPCVGRVPLAGPRRERGAITGRVGCRRHHRPSLAPGDRLACRPVSLTGSTHWRRRMPTTGCISQFVGWNERLGSTQLLLRPSRGRDFEFARALHRPESGSSNPSSVPVRRKST
jgi:uncharacterized membrane protein YkvA (DUF1232 family)